LLVQPGRLEDSHLSRHRDLYAFIIEGRKENLGMGLGGRSVVLSPQQLNGGTIGKWDRGGKAQRDCLVEVHDKHLVQWVAGLRKNLGGGGQG